MNGVAYWIAIALVIGGLVPVTLVAFSAAAAMAAGPGGLVHTMRTTHRAASRYLWVVVAPVTLVALGLIAWAIVVAPPVAALAWAGAVGGALGLAALMMISQPGYRAGLLPMRMPVNIGRMILGPHAKRPQVLSVGLSYHLFGGVALGITYALLFGTLAWWWGIVYGLAVATIFGFTPPILRSGSGPFFIGKGWGAPAVIYTAHAAYGLVLGLVVAWLATDAGLLQQWFGATAPMGY